MRIFLRYFALIVLTIAAFGCGVSESDSPSEMPVEPTSNTLIQSARTPPASPRGLQRVSNPVPGQYVIVLNNMAPGATPASTSAIANELIARYGGKILFTYQHAISGFAVIADDSEAGALALDPAVDYAIENEFIYVNKGSGAIQSSAPWGLDRIDRHTLPLNQKYGYFTTGTGVHVYIIDTGIRTEHAEFGGRATADYTAINDGNGAIDCNGHGTHVAGIVGGTTWGVAKGVQLHAVRVLPCGGPGTAASVIAGVDWVTAQHQNPAVANMSLGGGAYAPLDQAVTGSIASGVTYVVAAGNVNTDACGQSPARVPSAITVGATDNSDTRSTFSNWGPCLDLFAPGSAITSSWYTTNTATAMLSGTSQAAPHVAGAAALYLEGYPNSSPAAVSQAILIRSTLNVVASPMGSPNKFLFSQMSFCSSPLTQDGAFFCDSGHYCTCGPAGVCYTADNAKSTAYCGLL